MTKALSVVAEVLAPITTVLGATPARWVHLATHVSADLFTRPAGPDEWSARDCLQHLLDTEIKLYPPRVAAFLAGQDFAAFDAAAEAGDYHDQTPVLLATTFAHQRAANLAVLEALVLEDLGRTVRHPTFGPVTLLQMLYSWAAHDLNHTAQAEDALMQPFIAGSGPWRGYFKAHDRGAGGEA
jgi:hypothetical protein